MIVSTKAKVWMVGEDDDLGPCVWIQGLDSKENIAGVACLPVGTIEEAQALACILYKPVPVELDSEGDRQQELNFG